MDYRDLINQIRYHPWLTTVLVTLIIGSNAWTVVGLVNTPDPQQDYWQIAVDSLYCDPMKWPEHPIDHGLKRNALKWWFHCVSWTYTHSVKTIPLVFNIGVMPLVYLIAYRLTNDRLIALISLVAFINNPLYRDWYTSGTYDNTWTFFLLLSVYLMFHTKLSGPAYWLALLGKGVSLLYLPAWIYSHHRIRKNNAELIIIIGIMAAIALSVHYMVNIVGNDVGFYPERWEEAVYRNISVLWQVIPFIALFIVLSRNFIPKNKVPNEKIIWAWMLCAIIQNPIVYFFTMQDTYSYRYAPLAAFFSIFIGMTLVNIGNWWQERQLAKTRAL